MTITFVKQDITTVTEGVIAHGVNCQVAMGSGVAKALYEKWPNVRNQFLKRHYYGPKYLGKVDYVKEGLVTIANCYTQEFYGRKIRIYASPQAVKEALFQVVGNAHVYAVPLHLPRIACGLAGLSWETEVGPMLTTIDNHFNNEVNIIVYDLP